MEITEHVEQMRIETQRLVERIAATGLATAVPTCPGWTMRDLAVHTAMAHRWAAAVIERRVQSRTDVTPMEALGTVPPDGEFAGWLTAGQQHLGEVIAATPPDADFWRFMRNATSSLAFWARRQAHETAIHRVDADLAGGVQPGGVAARFAADGVDELVLGFAPRYRPGPITATTIRFSATDVGRAWTVALAEGSIEATTDGAAADADLRIDATAADLYLLLWNRGGIERATLHGDASALDTWRAAVAV